MKYSQMSATTLEKELALQMEKYKDFKARHLNLDMSRGKPSAEQLVLTQDMLGVISKPEDCILESGLDCRNYGLLDGIPSAKQLFSDILDMPCKNLIVCGNSSLNIMYDTVVRAMLYGTYPTMIPWVRQGAVRFLCPAPGYDRHFAICQSLGIEMITIPMTKDGPDMNMVERLVKDDPNIKGIWCVPKYSNPDGITYSDDTVRRLARMECAAPDFRIFWDNAYAVHDLYEDRADDLLNIYFEAKAAGNKDRVFMFTSTSKISFPGSGISVIAASTNNIKQIKSVMTVQTIGYDKLNMLRHARYFQDVEDIQDHMRRHAAIIRPKFQTVLNAFEKELAPCGIAEWTNPNGGYFISLNVMEGCAKRVYELCKEAGVVLTTAGATFPYGRDPHDRNLRIAPTYPPVSELEAAVEVLVVCVKIAALEKLIEK